MKASTILLYGIAAFALYLFAKQNGFNLSIAPGNTKTASQTGGSQSIVKKDDFQTVADDITTIFGGLLNKAQTSPKTA